MRALLTVVFLAILAGMLWVTTTASLERGVFEASAALWPDGWFRATLADAYAGFLTIYVWIAARERTLLARLVWLALLMTLGNIAISVYVLLALRRLGPDEPVTALLSPRAAGPAAS